MNHVILDLEWNQPVTNALYRSGRLGERLVFEVIQIGAVRLNADFEYTGSFCRYIAPTQFVKLHPRIRKITGITQEILGDAPGFPEVFEEFTEFCGPDCRLFTWGGDDISVLEQNRKFYGCGEPLGEVYNLQRVYGAFREQPQSQAALHTALEALEIPPEEDRPFHNAVHDAYYTMQILLRLKDSPDLFSYPVTARELRHSRKIREKTDLLSRKNSMPQALKKEAARMPSCPLCGKKLKLLEEYVKLDPKRSRALFECPDHGLVFVTAQRQRHTKGTTSIFLSTKIADEQSHAYVVTKRQQWKNKLASQQNT